LGDKDCVIDNDMTRDVFERTYPAQEGTDRVSGDCKIHTGEDFGHIDFVWSDKESTGHIYDKISKFLLSH
jgi:hypothetical protein